MFLCSLTIGYARAEANAEHLKACPKGQSMDLSIPWRDAKSAKVDFSSWQVRSNEADGKAGSAIGVHYKFSKEHINPSQVLKLQLGFSGVSNPALAYIYPLDNARLAEPNKRGIYIKLVSREINLTSVQILVPKQGGGLAIMTCQNGHSSIFSLNLPSREMTLQPNAGPVSTDVQGRPIIRMQAD